MASHPVFNFFFIPEILSPLRSKCGLCRYFPPRLKDKQTNRTKLCQDNRVFCSYYTLLLRKKIAFSSCDIKTIPNVGLGNVVKEGKIRSIMSVKFIHSSILESEQTEWAFTFYEILMKEIGHL